MPSFRPRRTALYVPGSNERALDKAFDLDADVVILDLEDAVAPEAKREARERVAGRLASMTGSRDGGPEVVVRINGLATEWGRDDLLAIAPRQPDAVLLPKVSFAADVESVRALLAERGFAEQVRLWAMIETPRAVLDPLSIATAAGGAPPLEALVLGLNDLARETGTRQIRGRAPMLPWMMHALAAARVAGLAILDGVYTDLADGAGFAEECTQARDCGFDGKTVIHPAQIAPCNAAFAPTAEELAAAGRIVAAFQAPENVGRAALVVDGRMVEPLHAELATRTLALAEAIEARLAARRSRP